MNRPFLISLICTALLLCNGCFVSNIFHNNITTTEKQNSIKWADLEDIAKQNKKKSKKVIIDFYTDWCIPCKRMDKTTFQNPEIISYINKNFHIVKINGEATNPINFKGKTYNYVVEDYKEYHQLTRKLLTNKIVYPSYVFLDENLEVIQTLSGYLDSKSFDMVLHYFAEDYHQKMSWENFTKKYKSPIEEEIGSHNFSHSFDIQTIFASE